MKDLNTTTYRLEPGTNRVFNEQQFYDQYFHQLPDGGIFTIFDSWTEVRVDIPYDSSADTLTHIKRVNELLIDSAKELLNRAQVHDTSKTEEHEKPWFDKLTPKLKTLKYGTPEYQDSLKELKIALDHHYANNSHHPEHYENGIDGMNMFDLLEMIVDWKAATERTKEGDIRKSIEINAERFKMSDQLKIIFSNTVNFLKF